MPVLFLPVNIETRFMTSAAGAPELWVRIYPDQIAINSHEPELTAQEIADGTGLLGCGVARRQSAGVDRYREGSMARAGAALRISARGVDCFADDADATSTRSRWQPRPTAARRARLRFIPRRQRAPRRGPSRRSRRRCPMPGPWSR